LILTFVVDSAGADITIGGFSIPILFPSLATGLTVTTIDIIQRMEQLGMCHLWVYATEPDQTHAFTTAPAHVEHRIRNLRAFGVSLGRTSDIDELTEEMPIIKYVPVDLH